MSVQDEGKTIGDLRTERGLYLDQWERHLPPGCRVLDIGGGIGRFTQWLLQRGCAVELVDPDLRSLWRAVNSAVNLPGALDVHWTTGEKLPPMAPVDVVIACEVLCYVEDPQRVMANLLSVLKPGGMLLISVESRWGWAMAADAQAGTISSFFTGIVHVPGDVWVRTYTEEDFRQLLSPLDIVAFQPSHYALSGPFELAAGDEALLPFASRLRLVIDAPSLGGVETLISLPATMSHSGMSPEERLRAGVVPGLVRVAVGIEDPGDLVADFLQALEA